MSGQAIDTFLFDLAYTRVVYLQAVWVNCVAEVRAGKIVGSTIMIGFRHH